MKAFIKIPIPSFLIVFLLALPLSPKLQAVNPPPDGGYTGGNTAEGTNALLSLTSGVWNTALGYQSLFHDTTGNQNTGIGYQTLLNTTTGSASVATGAQTLFHNTTGSLNTADGFRALYSNTSGSNNTANGFDALVFNTTANENTADGSQALFNNTTGSDNTAVGFNALYSNITALNNTAVGSEALFSNRSGESNTATGKGALFGNGTGSGNTANGVNALSGGRNGNVTGDLNNNTAIGANALIGGQLSQPQNNTAVGAETLPLNSSGGENNIAIGYQAGANLGSGDNNIYIGDLGIDQDSGTIRIGTAGTQTTTFIAGITGTAVTGAAVVVNGNGQLGVAPSSERFKDEIKPMDQASEAILALKPVTFRYNKEIDAERTPQFGLLAEEVAKVNPTLVVRDNNGDIYTVRYDAVNAMLLNEFLKEHRKIEQLTKDFESKIAQQQKQIEALSAGLQKVSVQCDPGRSTTRLVTNNH